MIANSTCQSPYQSSRSSAFLGSIAASAVVAAVAMFSAVPAQAVTTLSVDPGFADVLPNAGAPNGGFNPAGWTNPDGVGQGSPITYFDSSTGGLGLKVSPTTNQTLRFTYLGKEAGYTNTSYIIGFNGDTLFNTGTSAYGDTKTVVFNGTITAGLVPFEFHASTGDSARNGGPISAGLRIAFSDIFANAYSALGTVYAFFDDGGAGPDHDYDDLVMRISVVPVPPALLLFGSGLAGLGLLARRRRQKAAVNAI